MRCDGASVDRCNRCDVRSCDQFGAGNYLMRCDWCRRSIGAMRPVDERDGHFLLSGTFEFGHNGTIDGQESAMMDGIDVAGMGWIRPNDNRTVRARRAVPLSACGTSRADIETDTCRTCISPTKLPRLTQIAPEPAPLDSGVHPPSQRHSPPTITASNAASAASPD